VTRAVLADVDSSADPCSDFYQYACGGWLARVPPPDDRPQVMRSFTSMDTRNRALLVEVLERPGGDRGARQASAFFDACLDVAAIETQGLRPLEPWLHEIDAVTDLRSFFAEAGRLRRVPGASPLVTAGLERDPRDPTRYAWLVAPGGFGLPDPRLYDDPTHHGLVARYREHVARLIELAGARRIRARTEARAVFALERDLARAARSGEPGPPGRSTRAPTVPATASASAAAPTLAASVGASGPAPSGRAALEALDPSLPWDAWLAGLGAPDIQDIDVVDPGFVRRAGAVLRRADPVALRAYLRWQLLNAAAPRLGRAFAEAAFDFQSRLTGQLSVPPRPERCAEATLASLPDLVSRLWIEAAFPDDSRALAEGMARGIAAAFGTSLPELTWMDDATRAAAAEKASRVALRIGYPDALPADAGFAVDRDRYFEDAVAAQSARLARELAAVGGPADPDAWPVAAVAMRGYYDARANALVFPAGFLQPPLFDRALPAPMRWGAAGAAMGHEWTHGFDAQGALFDADGRLDPWWSDASRRRFGAAAQCLVDRYARYEIEPGLAVDGRRTLAENAADLGGVALAWRAWQTEAGPAGVQAASPVPGLTNAQLFFVAYAQGWCARSRPGFDAYMARRDPRARPRFRVDGPLANLPAFRDAFSCRSGTPMAPVPACRIW
jgi:putative endopeptidase